MIRIRIDCFYLYLRPIVQDLPSESEVAPGSLQFGPIREGFAAAVAIDFAVE